MQQLARCFAVRAGYLRDSVSTVTPGVRDAVCQTEELRKQQREQQAKHQQQRYTRLVGFCLLLCAHAGPEY